MKLGPLYPPRKGAWQWVVGFVGGAGAACGLLAAYGALRLYRPSDLALLTTLALRLADTSFARAGPEEEGDGLAPAGLDLAHLSSVPPSPLSLTLSLGRYQAPS